MAELPTLSLHLSRTFNFSLCAWWLQQGVLDGLNGSQGGGGMIRRVRRRGKQNGYFAPNPTRVL